MEDRETPNQESLTLDQTIIPFENTQTGENLFKEYPFRFEIDGQVIEGKVHIKMNDSTLIDYSPPLVLFPLTSESAGYQISAQDHDLEGRRSKIEEYEKAYPGIEIVREPEYLAGNINRLTLRFIDNNFRGFSPEQQQLLKKIRVIVKLSDLAKIRELEGGIVFPSDIRGTSPRIPTLGNNTFGVVPVFYPREEGPLASNNPVTHSDGKIGPGHTMIMPNHPELLQPTQFSFTCKF